MSYLSIANFWKYQNADVWGKSKGHPPWFKHYVHRDRELDKLDPLARLLFYELLGAATRHKNVLESDPKWLFTETLMEPEEIAKHLPALLKGAWVKATERPVRSRKPSRKYRDKPRDLIEEEVEEEELPLTPAQQGDLESLRDKAWNPRALGTNPRAVAERDRRQASLAAFVSRSWEDYPNTEVLIDELCDRGCARDEAETLVEAERGKRLEVAA